MLKGGIPSVAALMLALGASAVASTVGAQQSSSTADADIVWSGRFQAVNQNSGGLQMVRTQRVEGTVKITTPAGSPRSKLLVSVNTGARESEVVTWAVAPGRCGSGSIPLAAVSQFPALEITNSGRGEVNAEMALQMTSGGSFHVNLYRGGENLANVFACASLRMGK